MAFYMEATKLKEQLLEAIRTLQYSTDPIEREKAANQLTNFINEIL
jgi:hypothetical protein